MRCLQDKTFWLYYCSLSKVKLLTPEEERELLRRYYENGDIEARNKILESCLRFIVKLAIKYAHNHEELKDLISAGNEGLLVAFSKFDLLRKVRFLSYATYWALLYMRNEQYKNLVVAPPAWYQKMLTKINKVHTKTLAKHQRLATIKEISKKLKITQAQAKKFEQFNFVELSPTLSTPENPIEEKERKKQTKTIVEKLLKLENTPLSKRELFVLRAYYGLLDGQPWTLKRIATYLQMSSERIRQLKRHAINTLQECVKLADLNVLEL